VPTEVGVAEALVVRMVVIVALGNVKVAVV
jgi:hypothetical protein